MSVWLGLRVVKVAFHEKWIASSCNGQSEGEKKQYKFMLPGKLRMQWILEQLVSEISDDDFKARCHPPFWSLYFGLYSHHLLSKMAFSTLDMSPFHRVTSLERVCPSCLVLVQWVLIPFWEQSLWQRR